MKKPQQLREYLTKFNPGLANNPEQLLVFVDEGNVNITDGGSLSFEYQYTLNLIVVDWTFAVDDLVVPILAWRYIYQPPNTSDNDFDISVDYLGGGASDIHIKIKLAERILVSTAQGDFKIKHLNDTCPPDFAPDWLVNIINTI